MKLYTRSSIEFFCTVRYTIGENITFTSSNEKHDFLTLQQLRKSSFPEGRLANLGISNVVTTILDQKYLLLTPKNGHYGLIAGYIPVGKKPQEVSLDEISEEIIAKREGVLVKPRGMSVDFSTKDGFTIQSSNAIFPGLLNKKVYVDGTYCSSQSYFDSVTSSAQVVFSYELVFDRVDGLYGAEEIFHKEEATLEGRIKGPLLLVALHDTPVLQLKNEAYHLVDGVFTKVASPTLREPFCPIGESISLELFCEQQNSL